ncbi:MAG: hypothetical protein LQ352_001905 [Teloschistes flavicans]|nr:MAG: hypothetical protein LQ352_001905 [Teloschistes flavicans]
MLDLTAASSHESISKCKDPSNPDRHLQYVPSTMKSETAVSIIFGTLNVFLAALAVLQAVKYTQKVEALLRANSVRRNAYFVVWVFTM